MTLEGGPLRDGNDPTRLAHFLILGRLGLGGMGVVYRAEDESLRRTIALKLLPVASGNVERHQRFLREARSAAAISHPNVAVVHQVGEADGRIYIAMELVEGESLRARLDRGPLDPTTARELATQMARGLAAAHDKGIVHRDLKPENVMVTPQGVVKLLDFGLAKPAGESTRSGKTEAGLAKTQTLVTSDEGQVIGTPEYMSPEQAMGEPIDLRSDVFSFGIVLYEMLSGTRPFRGATAAGVLVAVARDAPAPLREEAPDVDPDTEAIVLRCLAKRPSERFASASEIAAALMSRLSPRATTVSHADVKIVATKVEGRGHRGVAALSLALLLGTIAWWVARSPSAASTPSLVASQHAPASPTAVAITALPVPRTLVPEAASAYARAIQSLRDASLYVAMDELERASRLDPALAMAHLRAALLGPLLSFHGVTATREHLAAAEQLRATLDDREQTLLKIAEASVAEPRDDDALVAQMRSATERYPADAELAFLLGQQLSDSGWQEQARVALSRALVLDPDFATALWALGGTYEYDDQDRAISILSRCLEIAPSAGSCLRRRSAVYTDKGRCRELEAEARRMTVVEPSGTRPYEFLAMALAAVNAPRPSVEQALLKRTSLAGDADARAAMTVEGSLWLALLDGDLIAAEAAARSQLALAEGAQTESEHDLPMERLLDVLEERGDRARALSEADVFEKRSAAWTPDAPWGVHLRLALMRYDAGQIDRKTLSDTLQGLRNRGLAAGTTGTIAYGFGPSRALFLSKPDEAVDALAEHPTARESAIEDLPDYQWIRSFGLGRTLLLAGRPADAVAPLRAAARSCKVLMDADSGLAETIWLMRADLALGQALEQTGQPAEACAAYAPVLERWSHPIPRSVSVDAAREAMRRLRCAR